MNKKVNVNIADVDAVLGDLLIALSESATKHGLEKLKGDDFIATNISICTSLLTTMLNKLNKFSGNKIDMEKTINTIFEMIKFRMKSN